MRNQGEYRVVSNARMYFWLTSIRLFPFFLEQFLNSRGRWARVMSAQNFGIIDRHQRGIGGISPHTT